MTENPYSTPRSVVSDHALSHDRVLYEVGRSQKTLLWLIGCAFVAAVLPLLRLFTGIVCILLSYRIARHVYPPGVAFLMCLLCGIPGVGLLALAAIHARGTRLLRSAGIRVGFLGADVSHLGPALGH